MESKIFGMKKNIAIMGVVSFLNDVSSEMVQPIVPIFLTTVLGAPASVVGIIEGTAESLSNFSMAFFGIISDKLQKRRLFVISGYGLSTISKLILAVAFSWPMVLLSRVTNRVGKGVRTSARDALIVESTSKDERGLSFGFHRMMDTAGAVFGPILALLLLALFVGNYRAMFFWAFVPSLLAVWLLMGLKEKDKVSLGFKQMKFEWSKTNTPFRIYLLISFLFAIGNSSSAFMILRAQNLGLSVALTVFAYVLYNTATAIFNIPAGMIADKFGSRKVLFIGYMLFAAVYIAFGWANSSVLMWVLFPLYGIYVSLTDGVSRAYISKLIPHEISASAFGIYQTVIGVGTLLSSVLAGFMWTYINPSTPFYFGGMMAIVSAIAFVVLTKKSVVS